MFELKDYTDFCEEHLCSECPLKDNIEGWYDCCMGFIVEHPNEAEEVIATWKKEVRQRQIANRQTIYIISDKYTNCVYAAASGKENAEKIIEKLATNALADCLAVDPEDSGIYWDELDEEHRKNFYEKEIKSGYCITETKLDTYKIDKVVELV